MSKYCHILASKSQLKWYVRSEIILSFSVIQDPALIRKSEQNPKGYEIVRAICKLHYDEKDYFEYQYIEGDEKFGWENQGYCNEYLPLTYKESKYIRLYSKDFNSPIDQKFKTYEKITT